MADISQVVSQVAGVASQVASIVGQLTGHPVAPSLPTTTAPTMTPDSLNLTQNVQPAPVQAPAPQPAAPQSGAMQVLSTLFSRIAAFFKNLFHSGTTAPATPTTAPTTAPATSTDGRELLFQMMPTGQGTALGLFPVSVSKQSDRIIVDAGSFGKAAVLKYNGDYLFYENNKAPVKIQSVTSSRDAAGNTHFDITLDGGKTVGADILADGHTLRYQNYTLTLR